MIFSRVLAVLLVVLAVCAPARAAVPGDAVDLVARHFAGLTTLTAAFKQTAADGRVTGGTMTLARPGKVRFDYGKTAPLLIVAKGGSLSLVDYKVAQVQVWPIRDTPLAVLLDPKLDLRAYLKAVAVPNGAPFVAVEATDPKRPQFGTITLYFQSEPSAPAGLRLAAWRVLDVQGATTIVELSGVRMNTPVARTAFDFRDPRASAHGKGR